MILKDGTNILHSVQIFVKTKWLLKLKLLFINYLSLFIIIKILYWSILSSPSSVAVWQ